MRVSRRTFLAGGASAALLTAMPSSLSAGNAPRTLRLANRQIDVGGKAATRYGVLQSSGAFGLTLNEGDEFNVEVENSLNVPSGLHWHGLTEPWRQDGVPYLSAPPIAPGAARHFQFAAAPPGTRWMHSHFGLQEQSLLAAPLIIREKSAVNSPAQEVVVFLEDFSWTSPEEIFAGLKKGGGMDMECGKPASMPPGPDLNDVTYDAYLANERTLDDPDVIEVERNGEVRLRIINASASTNFTIDLGDLQGTLVAVDGNAIAPLVDTRFPLAVAQRADVMLRMPPDGRAVAVIALGEGRNLRAGVVLRPPGATVGKMSATTDAQGPQVLLDQELRLQASAPLPSKTVNRSVPVDLTGNMKGYVWGMPINDTGGLPAVVQRGERVELVLRNTTPMAHPMHLHGHLFQVSEINGTKVQGAIRDTIHMPPKANVKVVFDADNPGLWAFHCHNLYHMEAGMFATLVYGGFA